MKKVPEKFRLVCREGGWYYRRRVPKHLVATIGKNMVQVALGETTLKTAQRKRPFRDIEWDAIFAAGEKALAGGGAEADTASNAAPKVLTEAEAVQRVRTYVETSNERRRREALTADPLNPDERREWDKEL